MAQVSRENKVVLKSFTLFLFTGSRPIQRGKNRPAVKVSKAIEQPHGS